MKKLLTLLITAIVAVTCCFGLTACGDDGKVKIGLICLHDENSTYDKNFIDAMEAACEAKGVQLVLKTNIPEGEECYTAAVDLANQGCKAIFADSFGHEDYMIKAAKEYTDVQFCHATGTKAKTAGLDNFHNAFADIYKGRFIAGYAAGLKLTEMAANGGLDNKKNLDGSINIGYIGAFTYAEVISGFTSWYIGVTMGYHGAVNMKVKFTGSWYDETEERNAAIDLIENQNCVLISQHADSWGAPKACEEKNVPNVSYNGSTVSQCPNTFIISSRINWQPYYEYMIDGVTKEGATISSDWTASFGNYYDSKAGSVALTEIGSAAADGTSALLDEAVFYLQYEGFEVYDVNNFKVTVNKTEGSEKNVNATVDENGHLTSYKVGDVECIKTKTVGGRTVKYFAESDVELFRSAPYFDIQIDGIEYLNVKF